MVENNHLAQSSDGVGNISINTVRKVQVIYFSTTTRDIKKIEQREERRQHRKQLISSLTQDRSVSLIMVESDTGRLLVLQEEEEEEGKEGGREGHPTLF